MRHTNSADETLLTRETRVTERDDLPDFGVDEAVNAKLAAAVGQVTEAVRSGEVNRREALVRLSDLVYPIADDDPDVLDATTREAIMREINPVLTGAGFDAMVPWEF